MRSLTAPSGDANRHAASEKPIQALLTVVDGPTVDGEDVPDREPGFLTWQPHEPHLRCDLAVARRANDRSIPRVLTQSVQRVLVVALIANNDHEARLDA